MRKLILYFFALPFCAAAVDQVGVPALGTRSAYLGSYDQKPSNPGNYEALPHLAALVGASRVVINKAPAGGTNWVELAMGYFGNREGGNPYLNRTDVATDESFWYERLPCILFHQLYGGYRATPGMKEQFRIIDYHVAHL